MLYKFSVKNFKNFDELLEWDLSSGKYCFNEESVKNNILKNTVVYGKNGSGKSNLTYAIMDITTHLTDFTRLESHYIPYTNLNNKYKVADFCYEFKFGEDIVKYQYKKEKLMEVFDEIISINGNRVIYENYDKQERYVNLKGAEMLNVEERDESLSFVKYIIRNTKLDSDDEINKIFKKFQLFVEGMLYCGSGTFEGNIYQGFQNKKERITQAIIELKKVKELESYFKKLGINYSLGIGKDSEENEFISVQFRDRKANLLTVASHGTKVLLAFFYWLQQIDKITFLVVDEFDAFYHNDVSETLLRLMIQSPVQSLVTTHNTSIMSNDLLRPDSYFIIEDNKIASLPSKTQKDLRYAHNLEKMYNAGAFND